MQKVFVVSALIALLCLGTLAQAMITIETVPVGDPGNAGELSGAGAGGYGPDRICGSVGYNYRIGKYEVTAKQYTDFLNNKAKTDTYGLYNSNMWSDSSGCKIQRTGTSGNYSYTVASDWANRPVNYVSFGDACRFANWLGNGQGNGDTEIGAYTLTSNGIASNTVTRNAGWKWAVTSEDEWYKAAYYKGGGTNAGYWDYPMQSNTGGIIPSNDIKSPDGGNNANFYQNGYTIDSPYDRTNVGEFENSASAYGTFDQGGNVSELNEDIVYIVLGQGLDSQFRGLRGGSFVDHDVPLQASARHYTTPNNENLNIGFRVSERSSS